MRNLLRADCYRMFRKRWFWLCTIFMIAMSFLFMIIQSTAMDYTVSLDRVIFLPMAFYGVAAAALVSLFIGDDYADGVIRNKVIAGHSRNEIYFSAVLTCTLSCIAVYCFVILTTYGLGQFIFENNVTTTQLLIYLGYGVLNCIAYSGIFSMITLLNGNKTVSMIICMMMAFGMLFLCLHTNQVLIQEAIKDGVANPAYVEGTKRVIYGILHDINPGGQSAQLSAMNCLNPLRYIALDIFWIMVTMLGGCALYKNKDMM